MPDFLLGELEKSYSGMDQLAALRAVRDKYASDGENDKASRVECEYSLLLQDIERHHLDFNKIRGWGEPQANERPFVIKAGFENHIRERAAQTQNPIIGAIYNLAIWEFCHEHLAVGRAINHSIAAAEKYRELEDWISMAVSAWRSLSLAVQLGWTEYTERAKQTHFELIQKQEVAGNFRWHIELLRSLLGVAKALAILDLERMLTHVRNALSAYDLKGEKNLTILDDLDSIESEILTCLGQTEQARCL